MSLDRMIQSHPDVGDDFNADLAQAARHASLCALFCTSCADACLAEEMDMRQCIRVCLDCADICAVTARLAVRRAGQDAEMLRIQLDACIDACELCAEECARHDHEHCRLCAEMCRECAKDCQAALEGVN